MIDMERIAQAAYADEMDKIASAASQIVKAVANETTNEVSRELARKATKDIAKKTTSNIAKRTTSNITKKTAVNTIKKKQVDNIARKITKKTGKKPSKSTLNRLLSGKTLGIAGATAVGATVAPAAYKDYSMKMKLDGIKDLINNANS